jgi:hypothetical protein
VELVDQLLAILAGLIQGSPRSNYERPDMEKTRSWVPGTMPALSATPNHPGSVRIGLAQRAGRGRQ